MPPTPVILADLGELSKLPLELVLMVIGYLDIRSAARFTQVNRQVQFLLWSDKDYRLLRYCLFRHPSKYKQKRGPQKFSSPTSLAPLQDTNYHTLAHAVINPICAVCCHVSSTLDMRLDLSTGHNICFECGLNNAACIFIPVRLMQSYHKISLPYRLPEGQLILSSPRKAKHLTDHFSRFQRDNWWAGLARANRDTWEDWVLRQRALICKLPVDRYSQTGEELAPSE